MAGFWPWATEHWFLAFLLMGGFLLCVYEAVVGFVRVTSRFWRVLMVRKQGWPPAHLDSDGDSVELWRNRSPVTGQREKAS